jgi:hypothetical protein
MRPIFLVGAAAILAACGPESSAFELADGELHYRATTATGRPLLEGRLTLTFPTDSTVAGTWELQWSVGADTTSPVGPQIGTGALVGTRRADTLLLELNPGYVDNNVNLRGIATRGGLRGDWTWATIAGPYTSGPFSAVPD